MDQELTEELRNQLNAINRQYKIDVRKERDLPEVKLKWEPVDTTAYLEKNNFQNFRIIARPNEETDFLQTTYSQEELNPDSDQERKRRSGERIHCVSEIKISSEEDLAELVEKLRMRMFTVGRVKIYQVLVNDDCMELLNELMEIFRPEEMNYSILKEGGWSYIRIRLEALITALELVANDSTESVEKIQKDFNSRMMDAMKSFEDYFLIPTNDAFVSSSSTTQ